MLGWTVNIFTAGKVIAVALIAVAAVAYHIYEVRIARMQGALAERALWQEQRAKDLIAMQTRFNKEQAERDRIAIELTKKLAQREIEKADLEKVIAEVQAEEANRPVCGPLLPRRMSDELNRIGGPR